MYRLCSWNLSFKLRLVCPMYELWQGCPSCFFSVPYVWTWLFLFCFVGLISLECFVSCFFWPLVVLMSILFVFFWCELERVHSGDVISKPRHILFNGLAWEDVDCCVSGGWFPEYANFKVCLLPGYRLEKGTYTHFVLVCGVKLCVFMYMVYVWIDGIWVSSCRIIYD